jgi:L-threonylcarbamoyladenylate synthase
MALVLRLNTKQPDPALIDRAARVLRQGGVVLFPTETVYGIGADIRLAAAVRRIFELKQRPEGQPLMAHVADDEQLASHIAEMPEMGQRLARAFWPGPLALVLRCGKAVPDEAVSGGRTVGVRMVAHPVARALIKRLGAPLAGTSANLHGEPATSRFEHIDPGLLAGADVALDCGTCGAGVASTVLDLTGDAPRLVRAGVVTVEQIEAVLGARVARS